MNDISVIIVNYRGGDKLTSCLESLRKIEDIRFTFEVIVVDNQSNDGSLTKLVCDFPQFYFVSNSGNNGFANGCNLGAKCSVGSNLLFLNPDTIVNADALFNMLEEVKVRPEFSIVSCRQVRENGTRERPYGKFLTLFTLTGWLRAVRKIFSAGIVKSFEQTKHYIYPDWISGSVVMIKRDSFFRLGKWDEDFWMYFEDVDLCRRARNRDGEIVKMRSAVVGHFHGGSSRLNKEITVMTKTEVHKSRHVYISKHEKNEHAFYMHLLLILNNLVLGFFPALLGVVLFLNDRINVYALTYIKLAGYYFNVLKTGIWVSERSVNYSAVKNDTERRTEGSGFKRTYPLEW